MDNPPIHTILHPGHPLPFCWLVSQLAMGCVTCHTCHSCMMDFTPILGNPIVDGETCSAVHYQPKQPKTLPVLNRGGAGYETEADLCIKLNRQLILFQTHRLVTGTQTGHRHPSFRTKHDKTR